MARLPLADLVQARIFVECIFKERLPAWIEKSEEKYQRVQIFAEVAYNIWSDIDVEQNMGTRCAHIYTESVGAVEVLKLISADTTFKSLSVGQDVWGTLEKMDAVAQQTDIDPGPYRL